MKPFFVALALVLAFISCSSTPTLAQQHKRPRPAVRIGTFPSPGRQKFIDPNPFGRKADIRHPALRMYRAELFYATKMARPS